MGLSRCLSIVFSWMYDNFGGCVDSMPETLAASALSDELFPFTGKPNRMETICLNQNKLIDLDPFPSRGNRIVWKRKECPSLLAVNFPFPSRGNRIVWKRCTVEASGDESFILSFPFMGKPNRMEIFKTDRAELIF